MKRAILIVMISGAFILSGCSGGKIGGEADKNKIIHEKEPVRLVKINGSLYYETGEDSEVEARCGTLDGNLVKGADKYEIPLNDGETNFSGAKGYQTGSAENTVEIPIGDDWEIFEKIDTNADILKYKYCYVLEGRLPNAADDSEYLVLANDTEVTFEEASYKLLGSDISKTKDIYVLPTED